MLIRRESESQWKPVDLEWRSTDVSLTIEGKSITVPLKNFPDGEVDHYSSLACLAEEAIKEGLELKSCASCAWFRFSGMSHGFSGAQVGYCTLAGFRSRRGLVRIDHYSGEHIPVAGWPADLDAALNARLELSRKEPKPSRLNAFEGAIFGLAIGDALGFPAEFRKHSQIIDAFGPNGITGFVGLDDPAWLQRNVISETRFPPGTYSDDTQMSLAVSEALLDAGTQELDELMKAVSTRFIEWMNSPENNRAPGNSCMAGCRNLSAGISWEKAGIEESKGCGSAMRVAPIGLYYWHDHSNLLRVARASSLLTHRHDAAIEGAAAAALLVALALEKRSPREMFEEVMNECARNSSDFKSCFEKVPDLLNVDPSEALSSRGLGNGWVAEEAVACALYCFWRSPHDFERTVLTAANTDGDSDSIGCIAGSISGAFNGAHSIPTQWREEVENAAILKEHSVRLWEAAR